MKVHVLNAKQMADQFWGFFFFAYIKEDLMTTHIKLDFAL